MKIATQHYQDSVITPYGNNHWNGKEKIDISKEKDDAVILEISAKGKRAIQLKEKNEFEQDIVQVDKSADDLPAYSGMYDVDKTISSSLENCSKEEQGFVYDIIRENFLIGNGSSMSDEQHRGNAGRCRFAAGGTEQPAKAAEKGSAAAGARGAVLKPFPQRGRCVFDDRHRHRQGGIHQPQRPAHSGHLH